IKLFINSADKIFGPITTIRQNGKVTNHLPWTTFIFKPADWERVNDTRTIISDANNIQQYFSDEKQPTLWCAIPALEELQTAWESKGENPKYAIYKQAIHGGLGKIAKYYNRLDDKPVYILVLGIISLTFYIILHPYYKLNYIKMAWGGPEEQEMEIASGNPNAKNWYDEALKTIEKAVQEYWKEGKASNADKTTNVAVASSASKNPAPETLESEYDHHWRLLLEQASRKSDLGWSAELHHYLNDLPDGVSKDMDVIEWWSVSTFGFLSLLSM
ncbi:hypothetical protein BU15DRAFT_52767, partial [Melanogaster broomeanus]